MLCPMTNSLLWSDVDTLIDRLETIVDLSATCGKIAKRFRRIFERDGPEAAFTYLTKMVQKKKVTEKGFQRARVHYDSETLHKGD